MKCFFDSCTQADSHAIKNKSFGVFFSDTKNQNQLVHIHECCEVFLCLGGGKSFLIDDTVYDMSDKDLFIINPFEAHKVVPHPEETFRRYVLHVHPAFLYDHSDEDANLSNCFYASKKLTRISLSSDEVQVFTALFESLKENKAYGDDLYKKLRALEILLNISAIVSTRHKNTPSGESHKSVRLAIDYINTHYAGELSLQIVAKNAYVSPTQLSRLFSRYCGTTVTKYIIGKRISEAKKMLAEGRSVTDTAFLCGFGDYANFIRTFKKAVGVPPGKYKSYP